MIWTSKSKQPPRIGIIGNGFVGGAVRNGFSPTVGCDATVRTYDKDPNKSTHPLHTVVNKSDFIFISVPTPANNDGTMNSEILEQCISDIYTQCANGDAIFLIRSTVVPGTTRMIQEQYPDLPLVFNPEFLTERSANFDFINQSRFVIGSSDAQYSNAVADLYRWRFGRSSSILETNFESAEMIKYVTNTFFATKVSFLNDMYLLSKETGAIWEDVVDGFVQDGRVGHSHLNVPGHDGKFGFGGSCFPKDIQALITFGELCGVSMDTLKGVWKTNLKVRPERDWEQLKGRAVSEDLLLYSEADEARMDIIGQNGNDGQHYDEVKHFADGFHEGEWEKDGETIKR